MPRAIHRPLGRPPGAASLFAGGLALLLAAAGCGGPLLVIPGGRLSGTVVREPVTDWSFVDERFVDLETRPDEPYSVEINYFVREGQLFIDPAEGRKWLEHIRADPHVRVRFGSDVYPLTAVLVAQPSAPLDGFDPSRYVYRLDPR